MEMKLELNVNVNQLRHPAIMTDETIESETDSFPTILSIWRQGLACHWIDSHMMVSPSQIPFYNFE
jgi:hypothetical protein